MSKYVPPRRESIDDHLAVARSRVRLPGDGWTESLATRPWVESLFPDVISGPEQVKKRSGPGQGRRFRPRDYRDLLRVIRLKARGVKHHDDWIAHLWLWGRDYPIDRVRNTFSTVVAGLARQSLLDLAPTQRLRPEKFSAKYDRRVRQRPEGLIFQEGVDVLEPFVAFAFGPEFARHVKPDVAKMAAFLAEGSDCSAEELEPAIDELITTMKENKQQLSSEANQRLWKLVSSSLPSSLLHMLLSAPAVAEFQHSFQAVPGTLGTFGKRSTILESLHLATEEQWHRARRMFTSIWSGNVELMLSEIAEDIPPEDKPLLEFLSAGGNIQRRMATQAPWLRLHLFSLHLHHLVRSEKRD
jgi:hypothetical protein